jgi:hypothetical protein
MGCKPEPEPERPGRKMSRQIQQWVPVETSLASARQIMERHQFTCSVDSYDNLKTMTNDPEAFIWTTGIIRDGKFEAVTNITNLNCKWTDSTAKYDFTLTVINGQYVGRLRGSTWRL